VQLPLPPNLLFGGDDVIDVVDGERGHDRVEGAQVHVLRRVELAGEHAHQELQDENENSCQLECRARYNLSFDLT
jgi:hypothetical protein